MEIKDPLRSQDQVHPGMGNMTERYLGHLSRPKRIEWIKWLTEGLIITHLDVIHTNIDSFWPGTMIQIIDDPSQGIRIQKKGKRRFPLPRVILSLYP